MNRRDFLRNAAIIAAGTIAADQLELLERLAPRRLYWPGFNFGPRTIRVTTNAELDRLLREVYPEPVIADLFGTFSPIRSPLLVGPNITFRLNRGTQFRVA